MIFLVGQAHPPIHPTKHTAGESNWPSEKTCLYEFIVRSFLATCSTPAVGFETRLEICVAGEGFSTTGQLLKHLFKPAYTDNDRAETLTISKRTAAKRTISIPTPVPYRFLPPAKNS